MRVLVEVDKKQSACCSIDSDDVFTYEEDGCSIRKI